MSQSLDPSTPSTSTEHLWQAHPYYCNESNYYHNEVIETFSS